MKFTLKTLPRNSSVKDIIEEIKRVDKIVNKDVLIKTDFDLHSKMSSSNIIRRLDGWENALKLAGLANKYSGKSVTKKMKKQSAKNMTDNQILDELRRIAELKGNKFIRVKDINRYSSLIGPYVIRSRFGSLKKAILKAGLKISNHAKRYSEKECFENLLNVWTFYKRQPTYEEMKREPSKVGPKAYVIRWGSWRNALESFINLVNKENNEKQKNYIEETDNEELVNKEKIPSKPRPEDKHEIGLSLRYNVLKRDNFKCVKCGRSPATSIGIELHIDHKIPFSKGGKTVLENLETKCRDCNLGKGNRHID